MSPKSILICLTVLGLSVTWLYRYELALWIGKALLLQSLEAQ